MKKLSVFTAVFLSMVLCTTPAFAYGSLIGTHGRHGRSTTAASTQNTATQATTNTAAPAASPASSVLTNALASAATATATAAGTTVLAREVAASVLVNGMAVAGPVLYYKDMYYVPLEQLAGLMPSILTCGYAPAVFTFDTASVRQPDFKSLYMDEHVVFVSKTGTDMFYHKIDCSVVEQNGLANYLAIDIGFAENGRVDSAVPCQYCLPQ